MHDGRSTGGPQPDRDPPAPALCLGESLVGLICERPVGSFADGGAFVPHPGGAPTKVAVTAARHGVTLAALVSSGYDPAPAAVSLPAGVDCAARTTEHFGALG